MSKYRRYTRGAKHNKRENHKKKILFFGSLAVLFLIIFGSLILFGNKGNPKQEVIEQEENETVNEESEAKEMDEEDKDDEEEDEVNKPKDKNLEPAEKEEEEDEVTLKEIESNDSNVKEAYEGDWEPIGTTQEGAHTTVYESGSDDRKEIKEAVLMVTDLEEDNLVEHWIGRGGEDEVIATVSDNNYEEIYKVYLQWVDKEGWQPTKYEELNHYP